MTIKLRNFANDQVDQLEVKLNEILAKPESAGYQLVAVCPAPDGANLLLVFQKP
jgi:hypothetical protein